MEVLLRSQNLPCAAAVAVVLLRRTRKSEASGRPERSLLKNTFNALWPAETVRHFVHVGRCGVPSRAHVRLLPTRAHVHLVDIQRVISHDAVIAGVVED